ncbi:MAG: hypothetical protein A2Z20_04550 [Bdellovibrionales bacterium RBG_16_40_8]|nr:MAG: hypothetical protein A2Z20_04550 [Bdellovibrionales bacterium RBG_16_40_8]
MRQQISFLTQSRFYSPAFNAAIFDGPIRIYFAQYQEAQALKVYFIIQEQMKDVYSQVRDTFRRTDVNIFIMLYPSDEAYKMSFADLAQNSQIVVERLGRDFVVGVSGPISDKEVTTVYERVEEIVKALAETYPSSNLHLDYDEAFA